MPREATGLPDYELNLFLLAATEATELAGEGEIVAGFRCLSAGLERAQEEQEAGEIWGEKVVKLYREELDRYTATYGDPLLEQAGEAS